jgi:hypothetical protein
MEYWPLLRFEGDMAYTANVALTNVWNKGISRVTSGAKGTSITDINALLTNYSAQDVNRVYWAIKQEAIPSN